MHTLITDYGPTDAVVEYDGTLRPVHALLEDDDGIRWYLVPSPDSVPVAAWLRAHTDGTMGLVHRHAAGFYLVLGSEVFIEARTERSDGSYAIPGEAWQSLSDPPTIVALMAPAAAPEANSEFIHLHTHAEYSALDGLSMISEIVPLVVADGANALGLSDHGGCYGHPDLQAQCDKAGIKPIFGIEAYLVDDRLSRPEKGDEDAQKAARDYWHLCLWAVDNEGLSNLWAASTESYRDGFYGKPRMDWDTLRRHSKGIVASTACLRGPLLHKGLLDGNEEGARARLGRLMDIFGDRLYIEIHVNSLPQQIEANHKLVAMAREYKVPLLAAVDSHYPTKDDKESHRTWVSLQTNSDLTEGNEDLFADGQDYHVATAAEVRASLSYLDPDVVAEAMSNTVKIADACDARITITAEPPIFLGSHEEDAAELRRICEVNWHLNRYGKYDEQVHFDRFEREMDLLVRKHFCGYFLMVADYCGWARAHKIMVGPGRGSGAGSLVAYLSLITGVDPVDAELPFERFMTEGRTSLPDFDVDFPASKKMDLINYVISRYGEDSVAVVGSVMRLKSKGVLQKLSAAMKDQLPEGFFLVQKEISQIITDAEADTAGLGLTWEALWDKAGDLLQPYRDRYPTLFYWADRVVGRVNTYGQHAAGVVISSGTNLLSQLPMRRAEEGTGHMIAQWDKNVLEDMGLVKFDLLTLRTLDTIQECVDMIRERRGTEVDVYSWRDEYEDPQVWDEVASGHTLGVFQVETTLGTRYAKRIKALTLDDLADLVTVVRPGPRNSGLTEMYLDRRSGASPITYPDPRLEQVLARSLGTILYQEDVMALTMVLAKYTSDEADQVRKILGKKKVEAAQKEGRKFVQRAVENGMTQQAADFLWSQMEEFSRYCVTGDTQVHLASSGKSSDGKITVEALYNRISVPLMDPVSGRTKSGEEYAGPCVVCGVTESASWTRGACRACYVWRQKFTDPRRGLYGLTVEADGRIRPCRILTVHLHKPAQTWTVTLSDGRSITATGNHEHLTPSGLRRVDQLRVGDELLADAGYEKHGYVAAEQRSTVGDRLLRGSVNNAFGDANYGYVDGGFASLMAWTAQAPDACQECGHDGSEHRLERAHLDGNHANNVWSNLAMLCVSCHKKHDYAYNGRRRRWGKGRMTEAVTIISIEPRAVEPVYSVVMDDPHIWIGNGIATSNSFNRAHAYAYAVLAYWTAWLKVHYPLEFMAASMSTIDKERIPDFVQETKRMGYAVLPPDVNESGPGFTASGVGVRYGLQSIKGMGASAVTSLIAARPFDGWDQFAAAKPVDSGKTLLLARIGAFDSLVPNRRGLETTLLADKDGTATQCVFKDVAHDGPGGLPCHFDWAGEPLPVNPRTGKMLIKQKPLPKKCTKACRQYTAPAPIEAAEIEPYTSVDIRDIEFEMLGVYLSSTPFDDIKAEDRALLTAQAEALAQENSRPGSYLLCGLLTKVRKHTATDGRDMGFLGVETEAGTFDVVVFNTQWSKHHREFKVGSMAFLDVERNDRGISLQAFQPTN
jgi:DNA polymerase-3 subunit alpha